MYSLLREEGTDEKPPTRAFDRHPLGTQGILVLCHLLSESRNQSRVTSRY